MELILQMDRNYKRPVVLLKAYHHVRALIDTGARLPVWTLSEKELAAIGGVDQKQEVRFGGFGGNTVGKLFVIDLWIDQQKLLLKDLPIVVNETVNIRCPFILAAPCFEGTIYEIDTIRRYFRITAPDAQMAVRKFAYRILRDGDMEMYLQDDPS